MSKILVVLTLVFLSALNSYASTDVAGSKDHPLLTRFPDSRITSYTSNFNEREFLVGPKDGQPEKKELLEGTLTTIVYYHNIPENQPSPLQIIRNYQAAITGIGGEIIYERKPGPTNGGETTLKVISNDKEFWIRVEPQIYSAPTQSYRLDILERAAMKQQVKANLLLDELNLKGVVTLYIQFDTNKSEIKPDAKPILNEIVAMLKLAPDIKLSIEGHTDNIGGPEANLILSQNRANSIMEAVVAGGIDKVRLSAVGLGLNKPISDNATEEGRSKNRRVELIKK